MLRPLAIGALNLPDNLFLAPMAGITDVPVRLLARRYGATLCFTEMVSVNGLVREGQKSFDLVRSTPDDRPLGIQIFGEVPEVMGEGAALVAGYGDLIDINMGCPVRKVVGSGAGSALLREPLKIAAIIRAVRRRISLPLTIKIRSGWQAGEENYREIAAIAEAEGCDAVTLHPRTRAQMFSGKSSWEQIAEVSSLLAIPVIGSGDLFTPQDVAAMLAGTGCDGVMLARGAMGNPWLFRDTRRLLSGEPVVPPSPAERLEVSLFHFEQLVRWSGEKIAVREMRKHVSWYAKGLSGAAAFRAEVNRCDDRECFIRSIKEFFGQDSRDDQR
jgi:nifR3 family TIM-barrel protein